MIIRDLPLSESTAAECQASSCPWFQKGFCKLTGEVLGKMAVVKNVPIEEAAEQPTDTWAFENYEQFQDFSSECALGAWNRQDLALGRLPRALYLHAMDVTQYVRNVSFAFNNISGVFDVTDDKQNQVVEIHKAPNS